MAVVFFSGLQKLKQGESGVEQVFAKSQAGALTAGSLFLSSLGLLHNQTAQMLVQMWFC